jgi:hypothetical protein
MSKLTLLALSVFLGMQSQANAAPVFHFDYDSVDGEIHLGCEQTPLANDSWDWRVVCGKGTPIERNFGVHLMVRKHTRAVEPKMAIEILYYVTDRQVPNSPRFTSQANWLNFKDETDFQSVKLSQSVENDYAYLTVTLGQSSQRSTTSRTTN